LGLRLIVQPRRAPRFYQRHGFRPTATLPGLVTDGYEEILLRKFPLPGGQ